MTPSRHRGLAEGIPGARYAEIATGHLPFVERPEEWGRLMADFLRETRHGSETRHGGESRDGGGAS
ncbi:alpha/beta fold hydrolase [Streptomyces sp. NPDC060194]|uniref:alpha/beta fold hydrolase n=1 Tax=Streptomyces sp. NPDC060194 TaxID=3347069 RepID=UPI0036699691